MEDQFGQACQTGLASLSKLSRARTFSHEIFRLRAFRRTGRDRLRSDHESGIHGKDIAGARGVEKLAATHLDCRVKPPFSFLSGAMQMVFDVLESDRPSSARMRVKGKGIGASVTIETSIKLSPEMDGTRLEWSSEVTELGGLIKAVSRSLIEGACARSLAIRGSHSAIISIEHRNSGLSIASPLADCSPEQ